MVDICKSVKVDGVVIFAKHNLVVTNFLTKRQKSLKYKSFFNLHNMKQKDQNTYKKNKHYIQQQIKMTHDTQHD
jgi:hypothetical protein